MVQIWCSDTSLLVNPASDVWIMHYQLQKTGSQSIKFPNFWISVPMQRWSNVLLVALRSSEFRKVNATHQIILVCLVIVLCLLEWTHLACWANFSVIRNGWFLLATCLCEILFQIRENVIGDFWNVKKKFGDEAMSRTQTHEWDKRFKDGWTPNEDDEHSRQPSI